MSASGNSEPKSKRRTLKVLRYIPVEQIELTFHLEDGKTITLGDIKDLGPKVD